MELGPTSRNFFDSIHALRHYLHQDEYVLPSPSTLQSTPSSTSDIAIQHHQANQVVTATKIDSKPSLSTSYLTRLVTMGRKKSGKSKTNPWHKAYAHLNIPQTLAGPIPKRLRAIDGAKTRLKRATTVKAAAVERRLIERNLKDIDEVYRMIKEALSHRGDLHRWNEFPGLEQAVNRVNGITWSDLHGRGIPGGPVKYDIPKFDDDSSLSDSLEEGEIKEAETDIKKEARDDPGVSFNVEPPERISQPESATHHQLQPWPDQNGCSYEPVSAECPPGFQKQSMPQSSITLHGPHPTYCHGLPHHYYWPVVPPFYPSMPYYDIGLLPSTLDSTGRGEVYLQSPQRAGDAQLHAFPQRLAGPTPPAVPPYGFIPSPRLSSTGLQTPRSNLPQDPSAATKPLSPCPLPTATSDAPDSQQHAKRKLPTSTDASTSETSRPRKRRLPVATDFMSDDDEPQINRSKHSLPTNGVRDFGAWFQDQITGRKKKLSHLEHASSATDNRKGP